MSSIAYAKVIGAVLVVIVTVEWYAGTVESGGKRRDFDVLKDSRALFRWRSGTMREESLLDELLSTPTTDDNNNNNNNNENFVHVTDDEASSKDLPKVESQDIFEKWGNPKGALSVVFSNAAYFKEGLVPNLICGFKSLKWDSYVIVTTDQDAFDIAVRLGFQDHVHWDPLYWQGTSGQALRTTYNATPEYIDFIHKRTMFSRIIVNKLSHAGKVRQLIFTDGDTAWLRDPLEVIDYLTTNNIENCDGYVVNDAHNGGAWEKRMRVEPVGGFLVWNLNKKVRKMYKIWTEMMKCLNSREQPAMHASLSLLDAQTGRPWTDTSKVSPNTLVLCVLPEYHFPTSSHLSMQPTSRGPVSRYMAEYRYKTPASVRSSVAVAHSNLKVKANKVSWMSQFKFFTWEPLTEKCRVPDAVPFVPMTDFPASPLVPVSRGVGWAKLNENKGPWVHDMEQYLNTHRSPGENWTRCRDGFRKNPP